jgi:predicted nucleic-acid-binding protein
MIALDTNILVRYFAQDDIAQSAKASALIESLTDSTQGFISQIVLIEIVWVMQRLFEADRKTVTEIIQNMLVIPGFVLENRDAVKKAVDLYSSTSADFPDCLIAKVAEAAGCRVVVTFDVKAAKACGMQLMV